MSQRTNILFPVEILNRELDARLFLAAHVANETNRIFIGQFHAIRRLAGAMQQGLYVGQNIFSQPFWDTSFERYNFLKSRGFTIIHLDEEGGVYEGNEERWQWRLKRRLDPAKLDANDHICTWGTFQRDYYRSLHPACEENIIATGNPRFDVYKRPYREYYAEEAARLRERYSDFILFNTSWPTANNGRGLQEVFSLRRGYDTEDNQKRYDHVSRWTHQSQVLVRFMKLVTYLTIEFPNLNFVIRPHPAENIHYYQTIFRGIENVHVVHEGSVAPWLFASKALIQDGCTTGIEAYFGDVPIINYKSIENERYDLIVPDSLGPKYATEEEVAGRIREIMSTNENLKEATPVSPASIAALMIDSFQHNAFEQLSDVILRVAASMPAAKSPFDSHGYTATENLRQGVEQSKRRLRANFRKSRSGKMREFYGFRDTDVKRKIGMIEQIVQKKMGCVIHSSELLCLEA
jgi:surface carbohydrate biosynthesis protein